MQNKGTSIPEGKKLYLVTLEFFNGEKTNDFKKGFYAGNERELRENIDRYLDDYYGFSHSPGLDGTYYSSDMSLSASIRYWEEVTNYEQIGI